MRLKTVPLIIIQKLGYNYNSLNFRNNRDILNIITLISSSLFLLLLLPEIHGQDNNDLNLELVQVVFRHGDRNPIEPYPNDPYKDESNWPEGFSQLTKRGKRQQYKLGSYFRSRYHNFLNASYSPYEIHVESSDVDRTLMSAETNLAGLYPPLDPVGRWDPSLEWQPIPVHTRNSEYDNKLRLSAPCPRFEQINDEFKRSPLMTQLNKENQALYEYLSNHSGKSVKNPQDVDYLYDTLYIESLYNYTLPAWTKSIFPGGPMYNLTAWSFKLLTYTEEMQRLKAGPLLKQLIQNMKNRTEKHLDKRRKLFMYSGHDTTIASLLNILDVYDLIPPPYASAILIDLYRNTTSDQHFIQISYRNESTREPYILTIPHCNSSLCLFEDFVRITRPKIPEDWDLECRSAFLGLVGLSLAALLVGTMLSLVLLISMLAMLIIRRRRMQGKASYPYLHLQMDDEDQEA